MIDMNKKYRTRAGEDVELRVTDGRDRSYPVTGYMGSSTLLQSWTSTGAYFSDGTPSRYDLVEVPPEKIVYANVYYTDGKLFHGGAYVGYPPSNGSHPVGRIKINLADYVGRFDD